LAAGRTQVGRHPFVTATSLWLVVLALGACAPQGPTIAQTEVPPLAPGMARIWFLRTSLPPQFRALQAFSPMIFVNDAPVAATAAGTGFYRDFAPGTYRFTVQPLGLPTPQATTVDLAAGTQHYLQVDWVASWTQGYPPASWSFAPNTFAILNMAPQV